MTLALTSALFLMLAAPQGEAAPASAPPPSAAPSTAAPPSAASSPPQQSTPVAYQEQPSGLPFLIAGPVIASLGIPFSLLGNRSWRENCGPDSSYDECSRGTWQSLTSHTLSLVAYGTGIALTAVGGQLHGRYAAERDARERGRVRNRSGLVIAGAILLPTSLLGMVAARTMFWIPTPDCTTEQCVRDYQHGSTAVVGLLAGSAAASAGLMMYGFTYRRWVRNNVRLSLAPNVGRGSGGLMIRGSF